MRKQRNTFQMKKQDKTSFKKKTPSNLLKILKLVFISMWTKNFQMYKLNLEKSEESKIKLPRSIGSEKTKEFQKNIYFCFIDYAKAFDCVGHNKLWKILQKRWEYQIILPVSW